MESIAPPPQNSMQIFRSGRREAEAKAERKWVGNGGRGENREHGRGRTENCKKHRKLICEIDKVAKEEKHRNPEIAEKSRASRVE